MFENFSKAKILVIGDMLLDKYLSGKITKISYESPIPIVEVNNTSLKMGGAALVIENAAMLGAKVFAIGVIGNDEAGMWLKKRFQNLKVNTEGLVVDRGFHTPLRTRVTAEKYQVSRFDDAPTDLDKKKNTAIIQNLKRLVSKVDCIIICDYKMGVLTDQIIKAINEMVNKNKKKIIVSPVEDHQKYKNPSFVYRIKINDAINLLGVKPNEYTTEEICEKLHSLLKSNKIILTRGDEGITAYENGETEDISPTHHIARDITSVGEVLVAAFAVAYAIGEPFTKSCIIGNVAAGTMVEKFGSKNITREELEESFNNYHDFIMQK